MSDKPREPNDFCHQGEPIVLTNRQRLGERAIRDAIKDAAEGRRSRLAFKHIVDRAASEESECPAVKRFVQLLDDLIGAGAPQSKMLKIRDAIGLYIQSGYPMDIPADLLLLKQTCVHETRTQGRGDEAQDRVKVATRVDPTEMRAVIETAGVHRRTLERMEVVATKIVQRVERR